MPNVTASNGTEYHLWALPDLSSPEPEIGIAFTTLDNDLSDGYRSTRLFGSNTGVRKWRLNLPTLAGSDIGMPTVTDINGASVSREEYIWSLYTENKVTGTPFAYTDPRSGQYYLVDFEEDELSYQRMRVKLYSTGLTLRQRRLSGVTIFDVSKMPTATYGYDWYDQQGHGATWTDNSGTFSMTATGDVVFSANPQNGLNTVRLNGSASTGRLNASAWNGPIYEVFIVMKMRESTFSNNAGIFTGSVDSPMLVGTSGGTKFQNLIDPADEYYLNGVQYANSDMQAPMNSFGIVQLRAVAEGYDPSGTVQIGQNQAVGGTFAKADIAEIISFAQRVPKNDGRELIEHLTVKWGIV